MDTIAQYKAFAADCDRLAADAQSERHRKILQEMARIWRRLAQEAEPTKTKI
jgi:hypothetical protein